MSDTNLSVPSSAGEGESISFDAFYDGFQDRQSKLEVYIDGSLYDSKEGYNDLEITGTTVQHNGTTIKMIGYTYYQGWVDDETITKNIGIPGCDKSDLATSWDDKTYTDPNCGLPLGYTAVKTFYSEGPTNIQKTNTKESETAPTIDCSTQWDQWKNGYMRTAEVCSKDGYYYWVDYRAELVEPTGDRYNRDSDGMGFGTSDTSEGVYEDVIVWAYDYIVEEWKMYTPINTTLNEIDCSKAKSLLQEHDQKFSDNMLDTWKENCKAEGVNPSCLDITIEELDISFSVSIEPSSAQPGDTVELVTTFYNNMSDTDANVWFDWSGSESSGSATRTTLIPQMSIDVVEEVQLPSREGTFTYDITAYAEKDI